MTSHIYETTTSESTNAAAGFALTKYVNINDVINIKWLPIEERIEYSVAVMGFTAMYHNNVPNHLKLMQKVASTRNLRNINKGILIDTNQQSKTFEKQAGNILNKLTTNIRSVDTLSVFQTKVKNHFVDQALVRNFQD